MEFWKHELRLFGVIKTSTRQFPMAYLSNIDFRYQGDKSVLLTRLVDRTKPVLSALFWMDRNRRYFIFTGGSTDKGRPYTCMRCRQEEPSPNEDPNMIDMDITNKTTLHLYYIVCDQIDRHNRCRQ